MKRLPTIKHAVPLSILTEREELFKTVPLADKNFTFTMNIPGVTINKHSRK